MNLYDFQTVKDAIPIQRYLQDKGVTITNGNRFPATWRGSKDPNCSISDDGKVFCDHARGQEGGTVLDLAMKLEHLPTPLHAAQTLGDRYGLIPKTSHALRQNPCQDPEEKNHYARLIDQGYAHTKTYVYTDEQGEELYSVLKFTHPDGRKSFLQRTADHWGLKDVRRVLYNLPSVISSNTVYVVEGEKDADTLIALGLTATTNNGGAKNWSEDFNRFFQAKNVVILYDNDPAGIEHAKEVIRQINPIASSIKVLAPSTLPKGDVTDYLQKEGGTLQALLRRIDKTPFYDRRTASAQNAQYTIEQARERNATPFRNFTTEEETTPSGKTKEVERPINARTLVQELRERFIDFPRRLGNILFDFDLHAKTITHLVSPDALFAWIAIKSKKTIEWSRIRGALSQAQFSQALLLHVRQYQGIASAPHFPLRQDIFYTHNPLPQVRRSQTPHLDALIARFAPASQDYLPLLRALFMAPIFHGKGAPRPAWVIDSIDGKGVGKTTLVKLLAHLYGETPIDLDPITLKQDLTATIRRLISADGRSKRIALLDNIQGTFVSANLARLITAETLSGISPYGRTEETRANDITYIITSNAASLDDDIAQRAYTIKLRKAPRSTSWETDTRAYITLHRETIFAEILSELTTPTFTLQNPATRYPEFETALLAPACKTPETYAKTIALIQADVGSANATEDRAQEVADTFAEAIETILRQTPGASTQRPTFLTTAAISKIIVDSDTLRIERIGKSEIYEMIQSGLLPAFDKKIRVMQLNKKTIKRGLIWCGDTPLKRNEPLYVNIIQIEKNTLLFTHAEQHIFIWGNK